MVHRTRLLMCIVVMLGALAAGTATAATINVSPSGNTTSASLGKITFTNSNSTLGIRCNMTLGGSLASSASASAGTRIGAISRVEVVSCEGGTPRSINNLPYELTFLRLLTSGEALTGIEYNINRMSLSIAVTVFGIVLNCTYEGTVPVLLRVNAGLSELATMLSNVFSKTAESAGSCGATGSMSGSFGLSPQQRITLS